jgi:DnaJ-class molecular chaperone
LKDPYSILGVSKDASDEEIKSAYRALARKYHPDNYGDDNPLKELATDKMQEINLAYDEIQKIRSSGGGSSYRGGGNSYHGGGTYYDNYGSSGSSSGAYHEIRRCISSKKFGEAERRIAEIPISDRTAEWHYLNSVLLMHRGNVNDAMRELEMACSMEPGNMEYQKAKEMFNTTSRGYGSTYYGGQGYSYRNRSSVDDACDCCTNLICLDCLCECMGGDLIRCI